MLHGTATDEEKVNQLRIGLQQLIDQSDLNPFLKSYKAKRQALRNLQIKLEAAIREQRDVTIGQIFAAWEEDTVFTKIYTDENKVQQSVTSSNLEVIKSKRNIFIDDKPLKPDASANDSSSYSSLLALINKCSNIKLSPKYSFISKKDKDYVFDLVLDKVENRNKRIAMRQWKDKILRTAFFNLGYPSNKNNFLSTDIDDLYEELTSIVYFCEGVNLSFKDENSTKKSLIQKQARSLLKYLITGAPLSSDLIDFRVAKAILKEKDEDFLKCLREGVQDLFNNIDLSKIRPEQEQQLAMQISDILAMYTFFDPHNDKEKVLKIPQRRTNGKWELVEFDIIPIHLNYNPSTADMFEKKVTDEDGNIIKKDIHPSYPVYSYILRPRFYPDEIDPYLLFMGTPPDAGQGHFYAVQSDTTPGYSVGETMYIANRENICNALLKYVPKKQVNVTGQSLGGALSLFFSLDNPDLCKRVDAFNPPGLYQHSFNGPTSGESWKWNKLSKKDKENKVFVHYQKNDPINKIGFWDNDWELIKVYRPNPRPTHPVVQALFSPLISFYYAGVEVLTKWLAHIQTFSNVPGSIALRVSTVRDNAKKSRLHMTKFFPVFQKKVNDVINEKIKANNEKIAHEKKLKNSHSKNKMG